VKTYASKVFSRVISNALGVVKEGTPATDDQGHKGVWVTMQGRAIFIRDGETAEAALGRATGGKDAPKRTVMTPDEYAKSERDKQKKIREAQADRNVKRMGVLREEEQAAQVKQEEARMAAARDAADAKAKAEEQAARRGAEKPKGEKPKPEGEGTQRSIHQKAKNLAESLARDGFKIISTRTDEKLGGEKDGVQEIVEERTIEEWKHPDGRKVSIHEISDKKTWDHKGAKEDAPMRLEVQRSSK
jgi:hypothetical protein